MREATVINDRINPAFRDYLNMMPESPLNEEILPEKRRMISSLVIKGHDENISKSEKIISGPEGAPDLRVIIYQPAERDSILPGVLYIHGGGMVSGTPDMEAPHSEQIALEVNCVVVSVDYRLAPENPYPAALEDCYAALKWFADHADELKVDPDRIALYGESAGGGLAAALALLARDRKGPAVAFQAPLYPMIDDRCETASNYEITDQRIWNGISNRTAWKMYLGSLDRNNLPIYAAPARAKDLSGLPPCYTFVGELDPFRDETIEYATRLIQSGVPTEFHLYPGCFHGFEGIVPDADISKRANAEFFKVLRDALHKN